MRAVSYPRSYARPLSFVFAAGLISVSPVFAAEGDASIGVATRGAEAAPEIVARNGFCASLAPADAATLQLAQLNDTQRAELDRLVAREILLAQQGGVRAFAGTFSGRRTVEEREASGLDLMSVGQLGLLDSRVAERIAQRPEHVPYATSFSSKSKIESLQLKPAPWEVHGAVTLGLGWGSGGRSWREAGLDVAATDPSGHVTIGVGYSVLSGDLPCDCVYPYGYVGARWGGGLGRGHAGCW